MMAERNLSKISDFVPELGQKSPNSSCGISLAFTETALWLASMVCVVSFFAMELDKKAFSQEAINDFRASLVSTPDVGGFDDQLHRSIMDADQSNWSTQRVASFADHAPANQHAAIAILNIPRLSIEAPVFEGALDNELERGPGRIRGTSDIGSSGNVGIAGHRDGYFRSLEGIEAGDSIEILGRDSAVSYRVTETWIVEPDAVHVLDLTDTSALTLVTCYPFYYVGSAPQRFIVRAIAVTE